MFNRLADLPVAEQPFGKCLDAKIFANQTPSKSRGAGTAGPCESPFLPPLRKSAKRTSEPRAVAGRPAPVQSRAAVGAGKCRVIFLHHTMLLRCCSLSHCRRIVCWKPERASRMHFINKSVCGVQRSSDISMRYGDFESVIRWRQRNLARRLPCLARRASIAPVISGVSALVHGAKRVAPHHPRHPVGQLPIVRAMR
jgi:hypothetical protein